MQLRNIANEVGDTFLDELLYFDIEGIHVSDSDLGGMEHQRTLVKILYGPM